MPEQSEREYGRVVTADARGRYWFVKRDKGGPDVYVGAEEVGSAGLKTLSVGDRVSFLVNVKSDGKSEAVYLKVEQAAPPESAQPTAGESGPPCSDYLPESYFEVREDKRYLRPEVLDALARKVAEQLGKPEFNPELKKKVRLSTGQLRRFFGEVRRIERVFALTGDFLAAREELGPLNSLTAYQVKRGLATPALMCFFKRNLELSIQDETGESFQRGFVQHFQSVVGYFIYIYGDKYGERRQ